MSMNFIQQVRKAISTLNPADIREMAQPRVRILIQAKTRSKAEGMEQFLVPDSISAKKRELLRPLVARSTDDELSGRFNLVFYELGTPIPEGWIADEDAFPFDPAEPGSLVPSVLDSRKDLDLPLARMFKPFRAEYAHRTVHAVSKENALFSLMTALPNVLPGLAQLPWAFGEFASDTAVLTANQIRMAFLLAAASDREVGYAEQRNEIGTIVAGAWGWRTLARELVGKIPLGGGLIPKAAIAYAGTYVVGESLDRFYRLGYGLTRKERKEAYNKAFARGRQVATILMERIKSRKELEADE